jgi:gamma-glutamyltranspeptidase/glutathione hydrolase
MLRLGGNAVDAAVAASFTLSVVRPYSCGIGGGGFMVIHMPDNPDSEAVGDPLNLAIDYREVAPLAAHANMFVDLPAEASRTGALAVAVPGAVDGLLYALRSFGTLDRATVLAPAIEAAQRGHTCDAHSVKLARQLERKIANQLRASGAHPDSSQRFLLDLAAQYQHTERGFSTVSNLAQARALQLIVDQGKYAFYSKLNKPGPIGQAIINAMQEHKGIITAQDLDLYSSWPSNTLVAHFAGRTIHTMPLPSSGGFALFQIFQMLEYHTARIAEAEHNSADFIHLVSQASQAAFADRAIHLADPRYADIPIKQLLDPAYIDSRAQQIFSDRANRFGGGSFDLPEDAGTSHISVIDANNNAVACTETINTEWGSLVAVPEFGFVLNNEMDDFATHPGEPNYYGLIQSGRNAPEPYKKPLSSMSPTIVLDAEGNPEIITGASGGPRIISAALQTILNVTLFDMPASRAVSAPRFHDQWVPLGIYFETNNFTFDPTAPESDMPFAQAHPDVIADLRARGFEILSLDDVAKAQLIRRVTDGWQAASDPRKGGLPAGH